MSVKLEAIVKLRDEFTKNSKQISTSINTFSGQFKKLGASINGAYSGLKSIESLLAVGAITYATKSVLDSVMGFQGLQNAMKAAVGDFTDSTAELSYIRQEADRIGIGFEKVSGDYIKFAASATRAGISLEETRKIFSDIAETSVSLKLSPERAKLVFEALNQIASKSVVQMEEIRGQLGDHLPAALNIAAKAMNMTVGEFANAVKNKEVIASEFLPKFAALVRSELGGSFDDASKQLAANMERMKNNFYDLKVEAGNTLLPIANEIVQKLVVKFRDASKYVKDHSEEIKSALSKIPEKFEQILNAIKSVGSYLWDKKDILSGVILIVGLGKAAIAINDFRMAFVSLSVAMAANPIMAVAAALASLGVIVALTTKDVDKYQKELGSNAAFRDQAEKIETLFLLIGKYDEVMQKTVITPMGKATTASRELFDEIDRLEGKLGALGVGLTGGVESKMNAAKKMLDEMQGNVGGSIAGLGDGKYKPITPQKKEFDKEGWDKWLDGLEKVSKEENALNRRLSEQAGALFDKRLNADMAELKAIFDIKMAKQKQAAEYDLMYRQTVLNNMEDGIKKELALIQFRYDREREIAKGNSDAIRSINKAEFIEKKAAEKAYISMVKENAMAQFSVVADSLEQLSGKNKVFMMAYKAATIAQIIMDSHKAASSVFAALIKTSAFLGPLAIPLAIGGAGAVYTAGAARAADVAGLKFANGVTKYRTSGRTTMTFGDNPGGQEEITVRPLSSPNVSGPSGTGDLSGTTYIFNLRDYTGNLIGSLRRELRANRDGDRFVRDLMAKMAVS